MIAVSASLLTEAIEHNCQLIIHLCKF